MQFALNLSVLLWSQLRPSLLLCYLRIVYNMFSPVLSLLLLILLPLFTLRVYLTICDGFISCSSACNMQHNLATALLIFFLLLYGFVIAAAATAAVIIVVVVAKQP